MKDFLKVVEDRKSIRSFKDEPVSHELIEKILDVAVQAPTNCNQQLWNFIIVDDPTIKERLVKEAASNTMFRRAPTLIVVTYDRWNYKEAIQGASLAVGHILLAANYYGVSGSAVNSYGADSKVKEVLGIPHHEVICCFVTLGYPDEKAIKAPPVPRKDAQNVTHWNKFEDKERAPYTYNPNDWSLDELRLHQRHYCRKTSLGKEMDLAGASERALVRKVLAESEGPFLDFSSYDGSYLKEFPEGQVESLDLTEETKAYTGHSGTHIKASYVYDEGAHRLPSNPRTITIIYKAERFSDEVLNKFFTQAYATLPKDGELIVISRRRPSLFSCFLFGLRFLFGKDVRKTGIYTFFGPYRPIKIRQIIKLARSASFSQVEWSGYLAFPGFFEQVYQMVVQFIRSGGSSYLHRDRRDDFVSRGINKLLEWQGLRRWGFLGSVAVIRCKK